MENRAITKMSDKEKNSVVVVILYFMYGFLLILCALVKVKYKMFGFFGNYPTGTKMLFRRGGGGLHGQSKKIKKGKISK